MDKSLLTFNEKQSERCVICHKKLNISKETPISQRKYYIEGCGQLCKYCFIEIEELN